MRRFGDHGFMQGPEIPGKWDLYDPVVYPEKMVNPMEYTSLHAAVDCFLKGC